MLTPEQQKWIDHLSNEKVITVVPFDPTAVEKFEKLKQYVQANLGPVPIEHHGASSLGISGQDEIDVYIPISPENFDTLIEPLKCLFGDPRSFYPLERVRFTTEVDGKHIDLFLINEQHLGWINSLIFEGYLRSHSDALEAYRDLKERNNGKTVREYYREKNEFINLILEKAGNSY